MSKKTQAMLGEMLMLVVTAILILLNVAGLTATLDYAIISMLFAIWFRTHVMQPAE